MGKGLIDLTGRRFERLLVLRRDTESTKKEPYWICECDCGTIKSIAGTSLREGRTKSCGCLNKEKKIERGKASLIDLSGKKFNHLTVIERVENDKRGESRWLCECDCENHTRLIVLSSNLRNSHTTSCGCIRNSKGEDLINQLLSSNNIPFEKEKTYPDLKSPNGFNLRFDFYINNQYLIEYDGETHYYSTHGWSTPEQLIKTKEYDKMKNEYCKENNIPLIRIPYTHLKELKFEDLLITSSFLLKYDE